MTVNKGEISIMYYITHLSLATYIYFHYSGKLHSGQS